MSSKEATCSGEGPGEGGRGPCSDVEERQKQAYLLASSGP